MHYNSLVGFPTCGRAEDRKGPSAARAAQNRVGRRPKEAPLEVELSGAAALEEGTWSRLRERRGTGKTVPLPRR